MTQPTDNKRAPGLPPRHTEPSPLELLACALEAARRDWHVIPLRPRDKRPAGHADKYCPGTGRCTDGHKTPEERATTDHDLLTAAWAQQPYNVGIATGPSGLLVVDLDTLKPEELKGTPDGATSFAALCERAGQDAPATYRVRTARGGEHLYFTQPPDARLHNTAGRLARKIDTRGWGGYVVAAGSTTPDGTYTLLDDRPPAVLPGWLHDALNPLSALQGARRCRSRPARAGTPQQHCGGGRQRGRGRGRHPQCDPAAGRTGAGSADRVRRPRPRGGRGGS